MSDQEQRLLALAKQILAWQSESNLSDAEICRKIPQIGSSKTYKKILNQDFSQLDVVKQLSNYESALAFLNALRTELPAEPEYDSFGNIQDSLLAVTTAMLEPTIARLVVIEGENGTGKDAAKNALLRQFPNVAIVVEATELWHDRNDPASSRSAALSEILEALNPIKRAKKGERVEKSAKPPRGANAKFRAIVEELNKTKTLLIINEAHHMGPSMLNIVKSIINQTPTVVVLECIPRLLAKLANSNYEEAIQLFGNRLCEKVVLQSPPAEEIAELFEKRGIKFDGPDTAAAASNILANEAAQFGNWRYVTQVARECWKRRGSSALTQKQFDDARKTALGRRIKREQ